MGYFFLEIFYAVSICVVNDDDKETDIMTESVAKKETHGFQTEVKQLLHLMVHSLYSHPEIFLRELISNASDAVDRLRFEALSNNKLMQKDSDPKIEITFDKKQKTISIKDGGIGMDYDEVVSNLGTIAKSGTKAFVESLTGDQNNDSQMIGQFGVGFYSSFMVADKVTVFTRRASLSAKKGVKWESKGDGEYTIEYLDRPSRGTEVILHIKKGCERFLDNHELRSIISKYSDHIAIPIDMPKSPEYDEDGKEKPAEGMETVNQAKALWTRPRKAIKKEEYQEFYKHISHDFQDPLIWSHNKVEGKQEYTSLLYIPSGAPFDLYEQDRKSGLKLYVRRVFIMDNADILPGYLRFVKGLIDSVDLPLNVSREILQSNDQVDKIKSASVKKVLSMLNKMAKNKQEDYQKFWEQFGRAMKEGPAEDYKNKEAVAKLLRFASTDGDTDTQNVSFDDYISRMKPEQKHIYYVVADTFAAAKHSPHLEVFRKKGIEVLLLSDRVDEWLMSHLTEFDGKTLQSVAKGTLDIDDKTTEEEKKELEKAEKDFESVLKQMQTALGEKVSSVRLTTRLTDSPACVVADEAGMSLHLQQMMQAAGQAMPSSAPILEINPEHRLVESLKSEQDDDKFADRASILLSQALLAEGRSLDDPANYVKLVNQYLS